MNQGVYTTNRRWLEAADETIKQFADNAEVVAKSLSHFRGLIVSKREDDNGLALRLRMANGAQLIDATQVDDHYVVLCRYSDPQPWVVWIARDMGDGLLQASNGQYSADLRKAVKTYYFTAGK